MSEPLVWLPFDPSHLGEVPAGLRYETVRSADPAELPDSGGEVEFYVAPYMMGQADPELFTRMHSLRVVQTMTAGVDHVRSAVPAGVLLCNGRGIHDASTSEMAVGLVLASMRGIPGFVRAQDRGEWTQHMRSSLADRRVLIVGYGQIGQALERRLEPFEVEIVRVARSAREGVHPINDLPELLPEADVVVLIVPGTEETRGLMGADLLARMKDGALLVNVARGPVVDPDALLAELRSGRISAALDVTDPEPLPKGHPLWQAPNLLLTPHVGGATDAMWPRAYRLVRQQLVRYAAGEQMANVMTGAY
ncbi:MAG: 2-hydroxyacid dehydrogenase [Marmoricola sp.]